MADIIPTELKGSKKYVNRWESICWGSLNGGRCHRGTDDTVIEGCKQNDKSGELFCSVAVNMADVKLLYGKCVKLGMSVLPTLLWLTLVTASAGVPAQSQWPPNAHSAGLKQSGGCCSLASRDGCSGSTRTAEARMTSFNHSLSPPLQKEATKPYNN